tara:strand:- start:246 stop:677 length:432 start_codon:yes stop_codon:yes gene_type:complete
MIYISHRGNLEGKQENNENNPDYIMQAIKQGFDVETDVWFDKMNFYLGHDEPTYKINSDFLLNKNLWCHAKNFDALDELSKINAHYFWHQEDDYTLTSKGIVWVYPGKLLSKNSICVMPELSNYQSLECLGICSDLIKNYKND